MAVTMYTPINNERRPTSRAGVLKPISQATSTRAVCTPMDASAENQTERYKFMPSYVVYQETMDSRQLATKSALTMGRLRPAKSLEVLEYTCPMRTVTRSCLAGFQLIRDRAARWSYSSSSSSPVLAALAAAMILSACSAGT